MNKSQEQRAAIIGYLHAIEASKAPGRKRTIERVMEERAMAEQTMAETLDPIRKLEAVQAIMDLDAEVRALKLGTPNPFPSIVAVDWRAAWRRWEELWHGLIVPIVGLLGLGTFLYCLARTLG